VSGVSSHPWPQLAALIKDALDRGESYRSLAKKTAGALSGSEINNIVLGKGIPGKWPATVPALKALAKAINQPWEIVADACLNDTGVAHVATHDGAHIVLARARETLTPEELETWEAMAAELVELVRRNRGK
jgi:hypothetical protein